MEKKHGDISAGAKSKYINVAYVPKPQHIDRENPFHKFDFKL